MSVEPAATPVTAAADRRRMGVWENEGGGLDAFPPSPGSDKRWLSAVRLSALPDDGVMGLELAGVPICLVRSEGAVHALLDECSHGQVLLSEGDVADGLVECWLHGSCFDLVTGMPTGPPAIIPVPVYPVRIVAGVIEVAVPPAERD